MEEKFPALWDTTEQNLFAILRLFSAVSHNGKNPLLLYPTTQENLLRCIPQQKKTLPLYPTTEKNLFRCIPQRQKNVELNSFTKKNFLLLTHE
jgi:hypothetical protein